MLPLRNLGSTLKVIHEGTALTAEGAHEPRRGNREERRGGRRSFVLSFD
jgi:hypothetical protein